MFKCERLGYVEKNLSTVRGLEFRHWFESEAYGYDPDDNHNVIIVAAVLDTAKAHAYWNSDMLKQRRAASRSCRNPTKICV
jgi:hypothetical protein